MHSTDHQALSGVFPVLPTPFTAEGQVDQSSLRNLVRYLLRSGVDGMTFPGVASEVAQLTKGERDELTQLVMDEVAGKVPVISGISSPTLATTQSLAVASVAAGASALMVAAPPDLKTTGEQIAYFQALSAAVPGVPLMLQNVPPPVGAGLEPGAVLEISRAVPGVRYVKEETLPSGQRLTAIRAQAPATLAGVFGGAGGRYITDELRRGAAGTMPAIELAEVHVALFKAHREGHEALVRNLFTRMLPILNVQAVFRWSLTKYVLKRRGLIAQDVQRMAGPVLDALDQRDVDAFLQDVQDLLLPEADLRACVTPSLEAVDGAA